MFLGRAVLPWLTPGYLTHGLLYGAWDPQVALPISLWAGQLVTAWFVSLSLALATLWPLVSLVREVTRPWEAWHCPFPDDEPPFPVPSGASTLACSFPLPRSLVLWPLMLRIF